MPDSRLSIRQTIVYYKNDENSAQPLCQALSMGATCYRITPSPAKIKKDGGYRRPS
jgi:hypothetical protein